jgi:hypothetical protein
VKHTVSVIDPTTGQLQDVDPEKAQADFLAGRAGLAPGADLHVADQDGQIRMLPAEKVQDALGSGWHLATDAEVQRSRAERQPLRAAVEGGLSALTLGGSDAAYKMAGVEGLQERRETTAGKAGTVLGVAGSVLGPGLVGRLGAGVAKTALEAALLPTLAIDGATQAITQGAEQALTSSVASAALRRVVASGVGHAATGAALGAAGVANEAALGNADVNAQHLLFGVGAGALMGAGLGGIAGKLRGAVATERLAPQSAAEMAASARAASIDMSDTAAAKWWPKAKGVVGIDPELVSPAGRRLRLDVDTALIEHAQELHGGITDAADVAAAAAKPRPMSVPKVAALIPKEGADYAVAQGRSALAEVAAHTDALDAEAAMLGTSADAWAPHSQAVQAASRRFIEQAPEATHREAAHLFSGLALLADRLETSPHPEIQTLAGSLQNGLSDEGVWGSAAKAYKELRTAALSHRELASRLSELAGTPDSAASYVRSLSSTANDELLTTAQAWRHADEALGTSAQELYAGAGAKGGAASKRLAKAAQGLEEDVPIAALVRPSVTSAPVAAMSLPGSALGSVVGAAAGGVMGGHWGALVGEHVGSSLMGGSKAAQTLGNARAIMDRVGLWSTSLAKAAVHGTEFSPIMGTAPIAATTAAIIDAKSDSDRADAYHVRDNQLAALSTPAGYVAAATPAVGPMTESMPQHAVSVSAAGQLALAVLQAQRPVAAAGTTPLSVDSYFVRPTPTARDMLRQAHVDAALQRPADVLERLMLGKPVQDYELDAVKQAYPKPVERLTNDVLSQLALLKKRPSGPTRDAISRLLGQPALTPLQYARSQAVHAPPPPAQPGAGPKKSPGGKSARPASLSMSSVSDSFATYPHTR